MSDKTQNNKTTEHYSPWRRGSQMASERDYLGIKSRTSTGFSNSAAKFDDTWGNNAFTETGFTEIGYCDTMDEGDNMMSSSTSATTSTTTTKDTKSSPSS